jgi:beta-phosphoglucomutase-like phosphatase (HAD superfamily)
MVFIKIQIGFLFICKEFLLFIKSHFHRAMLLIASIFHTFFVYGEHYKRNFIFDFGGVLISTNKVASLRHIGFINLALCSLQLRINPLYIDIYIKSRLFALFDEIIIAHKIDTAAYHPSFDEKGLPLPLLMSGWLQGLMTTQEVNTLIHESFSKHPEWFKCAAEKRLLEKTAHLIFTPEVFIGSRVISTACIAFIKRCKKEGHNVYGLSNWDTESFVLLKKHHPEVFALFDGIIISGEVKANKPHVTIYQALIERYQLQPHHCWFIDDQQENIEAAQKLGFNAIRHTSTFSLLVKNIRLAHKQIKIECPL